MIEYTIKGIVANGDGLALAFYTSDQGLDERSTTKIENGKFIFKGTSEYIKQVNIRFEDSIGSNIGYMRLPIYIEPGDITIKFDVSKESNDYRFSNFEVIEGPENKFVRSFFADYKKAIGDKPIWITSDPDEVRDLQMNVYPGVRSRILEVYDSYFKKDVSAIHLYILKWLTDQFRAPGAFEKNQLSREEIDQIMSFFQKLDTDLAKNGDYRRMKATLDRIAKPGLEKDFVDYELETIGGEKEYLSKLIKRNDFTILSFWSSSCTRCRAFHKKIKHSHEKLEQNRTGVISINVDDSKGLWQRSSLEDEITWPNLYAGQLSTILAVYQIRSFPAKIVYDKDLKFIDLETGNQDKLWRWM